MAQPDGSMAAGMFLPAMLHTSSSLLSAAIENDAHQDTSGVVLKGTALYSKAVFESSTPEVHWCTHISSCAPMFFSPAALPQSSHAPAALLLQTLYVRVPH
jgi:hypothetical protein